MAPFMSFFPTEEQVFGFFPSRPVSFSFSGFIFKDIAYISKPFIFLRYISLLHLALATPSNLDSSGMNPATASEILKQML